MSPQPRNRCRFQTVLPLLSHQVSEATRAELYEGHQAYLAQKAERDAERAAAREAEKAERAAKRKKGGDDSDSDTDRHKVCDMQKEGPHAMGCMHGDGMLQPAAQDASGW